MAPTPSHTTLFNDEHYRRCNLGPTHRLFHYDHHADERLVGTVAGVVVNGVLECGHSAPFGGVDFVRRRESAKIIVDLLQSTTAYARADGIREIRMRARPHYFGENESAVDFALLNAGAKIESCELSLGVPVGRFKRPDEYLSSLGKSARKMLQQAWRAGMTFEPAATEDEWQSCYDLLVEVRRRRGATLKIALGYIKELRGLFGKRIMMHRLLCNGELASAALVYRIAPDWDYVVAWGDDIKFRRNRAMNLMACHLLQLAVVQGVSVVDTGISSVGGTPDGNLIQFKRSIGAVVGLRTNYHFMLD
jgi:hypothetical protein